MFYVGLLKKNRMLRFRMNINPKALFKEKKTLRSKTLDNNLDKFQKTATWTEKDKQNFRYEDYGKT